MSSYNDQCCVQQRFYTTLQSICSQFNNLTIITVFFYHHPLNTSVSHVIRSDFINRRLSTHVIPTVILSVGHQELYYGANFPSFITDPLTTPTSLWLVASLPAPSGVRDGSLESMRNGMVGSRPVRCRFEKKNFVDSTSKRCCYISNVRGVKGKTRFWKFSNFVLERTTYLLKANEYFIIS